MGREDWLRRLGRWSLAVVVALAASALVSPPAGAAGDGSIAGRVYEDANRNGAQDAGEAPFADELIELHVADGGPFVDSVVSDGDGRFHFDGLADGRYRVRFNPTYWVDLRSSWVPTTTGSLYFERTVDVAGSATADFGLRRILRSTTLGSPMTSVTAASGMVVESYDDAVAAATVLAALESGSLLGGEAATTVIRFDYNTASSCVTSVVGSPGTYADFRATVWIGYLSWLDAGDETLFHEYGHAWSLYHDQVVQQDGTFSSYLQARGLAGDPRLGSVKDWTPRELIAEDYRQLFGSANARSYAQANRDIPPAAEVPGLEDFLRTIYVQPPGGPTSPPPETSPSPPLEITGLAMAPDPVSTEGTATLSLNEPATLTVDVVDGNGAVVRRLLAEVAAPAGSVAAVWDRRNDAGRKVKAGAYALRARAEDATGETAAATAGFSVVDPTRRK